MIRTLLVVALLVGVLPVTGVASVEQGRSWLSYSQKSDGSITTADTLVAPVASTTEAILAFDWSQAAFALDRSSAQSFVDGSADPGTEQLARLVSISELDRPPALALLLSHQNNDGGFGGYEGYDSDVLSTSIALIALAEYRAQYAAEIGKAIAYLNEEQSDSGAFRLGADVTPESSVTALCSAALHPYLYSHERALNAALRADSYLLSDMQARSQVMPDWELALSLLALVPVITDAALYADAVTELRNRQQANGAWSDDVFGTALALRALQLAQNANVPEPDGSADIYGRVIDLATGMPLPDAQVTILASQQTTDTDGLGRFSFGPVQAGSLDIIFELDGYYALQRTVTPNADEVIRLADIRLQRKFDATLLLGRVTDAVTQAGISGATLVTRGSGVTATTNGQGRYRKELSPGISEIDVNADGYAQRSTSVTATAGEWLIFSPVMYAPGENPGALIQVTGRAVDAEYGFPLVGALASVNGLLAVTDFNGRFTIDTTEGRGLAELSSTGYAVLRQELFVPAGGLTDLGDLPLSAQTTSQSGFALTGTIRSAQTNEVIAGATVNIDALSLAAKADAQGRYSLAIPSQPEFDVRFSAPGYVSELTGIRFESAGLLTYDVLLEPAVIGNVELESLETDNASIPAYTAIGVSAVLHNAGISPRSVVPMLQITDQAGLVIARLPLQQGTGGAVSPSVLMAADERHTITSSWFSGISPPGEYAMRLIVIDEITGQQLLVQDAPFTITPTANLSQLALRVSKSYSYQFADENITFFLDVTNRSNIPVGATVVLRQISPDGEVTEIFDQPLAMLPAQTQQQINLGGLLLHPELAGTYRYEASAEGWSISPAEMSVAPKVRINVSESVTPEVIAPGDQQRVRIDINLEGAGQ